MATLDIVGGLVVGGPPDALVTSTPSGKNWVMSSRGVLTCVLHDGVLWDECIRDAILEGRDESAIWDGYFKRAIDLVLVPLLPNEYNIFGLIRLARLNESILRTSLIPIGDFAGDRLPTQWVNLGVISRGDGRSVLRQMIIGQFAAVIGDDIKCESFRHNWRRKAELDANAKVNKSLALACAWCMFWYEKCYLCYKDDMRAQPSGSKFDPDLLPRI